MQLGTGLTLESVQTNAGHNCAVLANGAGVRQVKCWGLNTWGQLGRTEGISLSAAATLNDRLSCVGGVLDCVGDTGGPGGPTDPVGEMGDALPAIAAIGANFSRITLGYRHTCVRPTDNTQLVCWGSNERGQLGLPGGNVGDDVIIGDQLNEMTSLAAAFISGAVIEEATVGGFHSCVWNVNNTLNCWGDNQQGSWVTAATLALIPLGERRRDVVLRPYCLGTDRMPRRQPSAAGALLRFGSRNRGQRLIDFSHNIGTRLRAYWAEMCTLSYRRRRCR